MADVSAPGSAPSSKNTSDALGDSDGEDYLPSSNSDSQCSSDSEMDWDIEEQGRMKIGTPMANNDDDEALRGIEG